MRISDWSSDVCSSDLRERLGLFRWRTTMHYTLTNALPRGVTVDLLQDGLWGDTRIVSESAKSERQSADVAQWSVSVPANGSAGVCAGISEVGGVGKEGVGRGRVRWSPSP